MIVDIYDEVTHAVGHETPCTVWLLQWVEGVIDFWQDGNDDCDVEHVGRCLAESGCEASRVPLPCAVWVFSVYSHV